MLPCHDCTHHATIPGNAHIACRASWERPAIPVLLAHGMTMEEREAMRHGQDCGWFEFPGCFDPVWGPDRCPHFVPQQVNA